MPRKTARTQSQRTFNAPKVSHVNSTQLQASLLKPMTHSELQNVSYNIWMHGRDRPRKPPGTRHNELTLALRLPSKAPRHILSAMRWHLGTFPVPPEPGLLRDIIRIGARPLVTIRRMQATRKELLAVERSIDSITFFFESKHFIYSVCNVHSRETEQHYLNIVM